MNQTVYTATIVSGSHTGFFDGEKYRAGEEVMITENELSAFRDKFTNVKEAGQREGDKPAPVVPVEESNKGKTPIEVILAADPKLPKVKVSKSAKG